MGDDRNVLVAIITVTIIQYNIRGRTVLTGYIIELIKGAWRTQIIMKRGGCGDGIYI